MKTFPIHLHINGTSTTLNVPAERLLVDALRDDLGLTGTLVGCDTAQCGACTVLLNGRPVKSCNVLALQADGSQVQTVEGLACVTKESVQLHPLQQAFSDHHALQCGYCTPGMLMRCLGMVSEPVAASPSAVAQALAGNLCRCTGYEGIVKAACATLPVLRAQAATQQGGHDASV